MDKLVEILAEKKSITLSILIGLLLPSVLLIFIWSRIAFYELDFMKIILLASSIAIALGFPNYFLVELGVQIYYRTYKKNIDTREELTRDEMLLGFIIALFITFFEILVISCVKVFYVSLSLQELITVLFMIYMVVLIFEAMVKAVCFVLNILKRFIKIISAKIKWKWKR